MVFIIGIFKILKIHITLWLDEKESDKMHFMPFHEGVYKQVEEVFLSDIKQDYIVDASWAVSNTK